MDEYGREIGELGAQIDALVEAEADPKEIAELQMQLAVLRALYERARGLLELGRGEPQLRENLALRGYGDWTLDGVYAFVYDTSVDLPGDGHHSFLGQIRETDFAALLR